MFKKSILKGLSSGVLGVIFLLTVFSVFAAVWLSVSMIKNTEVTEVVGHGDINVNIQGGPNSKIHSSLLLPPDLDVIKGGQIVHAGSLPKNPGSDYPVYAEAGVEAIPGAYELLAEPHRHGASSAELDLEPSLSREPIVGGELPQTATKIKVIQLGRAMDDAVTAGLATIDGPPAKMHVKDQTDVTVRIGTGVSAAVMKQIFKPGHQHTFQIIDTGYKVKAKISGAGFSFKTDDPEVKVLGQGHPVTFSWVATAILPGDPNPRTVTVRLYAVNDGGPEVEILPTLSTEIEVTVLPQTAFQMAIEFLKSTKGIATGIGGILFLGGSPWWLKRIKDWWTTGVWNNGTPSRSRKPPADPQTPAEPVEKNVVVLKPSTRRRNGKIKPANENAVGVDEAASKN